MLVLVLIPLLFLDATLLRMNHIRMTELRDAVIAADARVDGDDAAAEDNLRQAMERLKEFVFHDVVVNVVEENGVERVSFGTGPFYLEHSYLKAARRALAEAEAQATGDGNPHGNVYAAAGEVCRAQALANGWDWDSPGFMNCMLSEIAKYPAAGEIQDTIIAKLPSTELYRRNYASPVWAPTVTGFMLLLTAVLVVVIIVRIVIYLVLRFALLFV